MIGPREAQAAVRVVQKYGGTSVADPERMRSVAEQIARSHRRDDEVIVVVSAMGKEPDDQLRTDEEVSG